MAAVAHQETTATDRPSERPDVALSGITRGGFEMPKYEFHEIIIIMDFTVCGTMTTRCLCRKDSCGVCGLCRLNIGDYKMYLPMVLLL
jgi:hypothetical protein